MVIQDQDGTPSWPGRLSPRDVRQKRFRPTRLGRRGLDPEEVRRYLRMVADDLAWLHRALAAANEETAQIKVALREWQTKHANWHDGYRRSELPLPWPEDPSPGR